MIDPERGLWTSASSASADALCPGRHFLSRNLPDVPNEEAAHGTAIHAALAGESGALEKLTPEQVETYERCGAMKQKALAEWRNEGEETTYEYREKRLWIELGSLRHSGQPDVVFVQGERALVLDFKTLLGNHEENPKNLQLRDLAVLAAVNYDVTEVTVRIIQPLAKAQPPCTYSAMDIALAMAELTNRISASNDPKAPRTPNDISCKFCKATGICPEFAAAALPVPFSATLTPSTDEIRHAIAHLSPERLGTFLAQVKLALEVTDRRVRYMISVGQTVPGWREAPGRKMETIVDPQLVWERFAAKGGTLEQFMSCLKLGKDKIRMALHALSGDKGQVLNEEFAKLIAGATETTVSKPILERTKDA